MIGFTGILRNSYLRSYCKRNCHTLKKLCNSAHHSLVLCQTITSVNIIIFYWNWRRLAGSRCTKSLCRYYTTMLRSRRSVHYKPTFHLSVSRVRLCNARLQNRKQFYSFLVANNLIFLTRSSNSLKIHENPRHIGRTYTAATIRQASKCGYVVDTWWRQEKKTSKKDLATNIAGRFTGDASQLEWCSQSGQWSHSVEKSGRLMLQQE